MNKQGWSSRLLLLKHLHCQQTVFQLLNLSDESIRRLLDSRDHPTQWNLNWLLQWKPFVEGILRRSQLLWLARVGTAGLAVQFLFSTLRATPSSLWLSRQLPGTSLKIPGLLWTASCWMNDPGSGEKEWWVGSHLYALWLVCHEEPALPSCCTPEPGLVVCPLQRCW